MSIAQLINERDSGFKSPVYILSCTDDYFYTEAMKIIVGVGSGQIINSYDLDDSSSPVSINSVLDILKTVSLFSEKQIVVIRNFQKAVKTFLIPIIEYRITPSNDTVLFIFHKKIKDKNKYLKNSSVIDSLIAPSQKDIKEIKDKNKHIKNLSVIDSLIAPSKKDIKDEFKDQPLCEIKAIDLDITKKDIPNWMTSRAKERGISITTDAVKFLNEIYGENLCMLSNEIDKLSLLGKKKLTMEDVTEIFYGEKEGNTFALTDAISEQDKVKAMKILNMVVSKTEPLMLLGALNWKISNIKDKDRAKIIRCCEVLIDTEMRLKGSNPTLPLDWTILKLMRALK
jgi:DNA polymerase III delta subunit